MPNLMRAIPNSLSTHLTAFGLILAILGEQMTKNIGAAARHVHQRALFPQTEAGRHGQDQRDGLDDQGPLAQVAADDEAAQDGLDLTKQKGDRNKNIASGMCSDHVVRSPRPACLYPRRITLDKRA